MKKVLLLAAALMIFAVAQAPAQAASPDKKEAVKTAVAPKAAKHVKKDAECQKQAHALKDGKAPSHKEAKAAYADCVKAKEEAAAAAKTEAKTEEKTETKAEAPKSEEPKVEEKTEEKK